MRRVRSRDTGPELAVRRALRKLRVGYRLDGSALPGRPDVVMKGRRLAVFVHGCFWHGHDCPRGARIPKSNTAYWTGKIARNRARDADAAAALQAMGWRAVVLWECELRGDAPALLAARLGLQATAASGPAASGAPAPSGAAAASDSTCSSAVSSAAGVRGLDTK
jgi:DNA mismatch endonuclease (patch repair protein)